MKHFTTWVGLDVHADSIRVAVLRGRDESPTLELEIVPDAKGTIRLLRKLKAMTSPVFCVYEAGPCGYELYRFLNDHGIECAVAAPSLIPRRPGDRVKTDRRDAQNLARLSRAGELTLIEVPDERREALRDLVRAREDLVEDALRRRHRLVKFLLRHGYRYRNGNAGSARFWKWFGQIRFDDQALQTVLEEYRISLDQALDQIRRLSEQIRALAEEPENQTKIGPLTTLRGIDTLTAMTILSEMGDLRRFRSAPEFMSAIGLVSSERSSGPKTRRGSITKTGNAHVRRVLVEAAWQYRHRPLVGAKVRQRRGRQPSCCVAIAEKADQRLYRKFQRLVFKGKPSTLAAVAVARELAGFVWALGQAA